MKPQPLSKTQGGNWWIIRRANGSINSQILERTKRDTIESFLEYIAQILPPTSLEAHNFSWKTFQKKGYSAERVQICTARPHGRGRGEGCPMRMKKDKP